MRPGCVGESCQQLQANSQCSDNNNGIITLASHRGFLRSMLTGMQGSISFPSSCLACSECSRNICRGQMNGHQQCRYHLQVVPVEHKATLPRSHFLLDSFLQMLMRQPFPDLCVPDKDSCGLRRPGAWLGLVNLSVHLSIPPSRSTTCSSPQLII